MLSKERTTKHIYLAASGMMQQQVKTTFIYYRVSTTKSTSVSFPVSREPNSTLRSAPVAGDTGIYRMTKVKFFLHR